MLYKSDICPCGVLLLSWTADPPFPPRRLPGHSEQASPSQPAAALDDVQSLVRFNSPCVPFVGCVDCGLCAGQRGALENPAPLSAPQMCLQQSQGVRTVVVVLRPICIQQSAAQRCAEVVTRVQRRCRQRRQQEKQCPPREATLPRPPQAHCQHF